MGSTENTFMRIIRELHRRSFWHVLAIYVAASWAVLEAADVLIDRLSLPEWIYGLAIILLLIGLPIVLGTAFIQEGGPTRDPGGGEARDPAGGSSGPLDTPARQPLFGAAGAERLLTWRNTIFGGVAASVLWALVTGSWIIFGSGGLNAGAGDGEGSRGSSSAVGRSVAVLPFANMSGDAENEYFSDGITEEILNALAQVPGLRVPGRTSSFSFKNTDLRISQIADTLGVSHILEGSVRRAGSQIRITAQLIDAGRDEHLWSETYDRRLDDVFAVQSEIAHAISDALEIQLGGDDETRISEGGTRDAEAHDAYLRGRFFWNQRTPESLRQAAAHFRRAIDADPAYTEAWSGLADTYSVMPFYAYLDTVALDLGELQEKALEASRRAVELGPEMAVSHTSLAYAHFFNGNWDDAEREFRRAVALNPGYATAHHWFGEFLAYTGRAEEGIAHSRRAVELDPLSKIVNRDFAHTLRLAGRTEEALRQALHTVDLDPSWAHGRRILVDLLLDTGRYDEALQQALERAWLLGADTAGIREIHDCWVRRLENDAPRRCNRSPVTPTDFFEEGLREEGLRALERAVRRDAVNYRGLTLMNEYLGDSDLLRGDRRYRELLAEIGITW